MYSLLNFTFGGLPVLGGVEYRSGNLAINSNLLNILAVYNKFCVIILQICHSIPFNLCRIELCSEQLL